jgi:hypothetical protein
MVTSQLIELKLPTELPNIKEPHSTGESVVLPAATNIVETVFG